MRPMSVERTNIQRNQLTDNAHPKLCFESLEFKFALGAHSSLSSLQRKRGEEKNRKRFIQFYIQHVC